MYMKNMTSEQIEREARANALRQIINITGDEYSMRVYAAMSNISLASLPDMRRAWINELRLIDGLSLSLDDIKFEAIMETKRLLARVLEIPIVFNDKQYSVTIEKQNLLSAQLGLFGLNSQAGIPMQLTWNSTGEECVPWEYENLLDLANTIALYVEPFVGAQRHVEVIIKDADSSESVNIALEKYKVVLAGVGDEQN
jgi:hypothetical protein